MECNEFKELADSYLCDELAVETNLRIIKHLDNCASCRRELTNRRQLRTTLKTALVDSPEFKIDPALTVKVREQLRADARPFGRFAGWRVLVPAVAAFGAVLIIAIGLFSGAILNRAGRLDPAFQTYLVEMSIKAIGDHRYCALDNLRLWENSDHELTTEQQTFIQSLTDEGIEVLDAHDCAFDDQSFGHFVLRRNGKIISVARIASDGAAVSNIKAQQLIMTEKDGGFQVASFQAGSSLVFVVSDLSEPENLALARKLSDSLTS